MSVGKICSRTVATASANESVLEAARRMTEFNVGTVVVVDDASRPVGFVTDRDVVLRCVAPGLAPSDTTISSIMSTEVRSVDESTSIEEALRIMAGAGKRRLVVTGRAGGLAGLVSLDDFLELLAEEATSVGELLRKGAPEMLSG